MRTEAPRFLKKLCVHWALFHSSVIWNHQRPPAVHPAACMAAEFRSRLAILVRDHPFNAQNYSQYASVVELANTEVFDDALACQRRTVAELQSAHPNLQGLQQRPAAKDWERFDAKKKSQRYDNAGFKVVCDLAAIRLVVDDLSQFWSMVCIESHTSFSYTPARAF